MTKDNMYFLQKTNIFFPKNIISVSEPVKMTFTVKRFQCFHFQTSLRVTAEITVVIYNEVQTHSL